MSAIAKVMHEMGYQVSGSDVTMHELSEKLRKNKVQVFVGHHKNQVKGADWVVYSTALPADNVELVEAREMNIPIFHRSEMLAKLMNQLNGIAIAGAHGKTTTSSMIAYVMVKNQCDPTYVIGGEVIDLGSNAHAGNGRYLIAEADESDGTFLHYSPQIAIVNNIEADHLEHYQGDFELLKKAYAQFMTNVKPNGTVVACSDDQLLVQMTKTITHNMITFGIDQPADYQAFEIQLGDRHVVFQVKRKGEFMGQMELTIPGKHNVYNALATLATCMEAGLTFEQVASSIIHFRGAKRRFQVLAEVDHRLVVDDYAHHPTEIEATLKAAKATGKRVIAVFQPQRYSRTYYLFDAFSRAFHDADQVIITDIYSPAGEKKLEGVDSAYLVESVRKHSNAMARHIPTREEALIYLLNNTQTGDLVITMGAGDIWKTSAALAEQWTSQYK